jgi:hypothetical protein
VAGVSKLGAAFALALAAAPLTDGALRTVVDKLVAAVSAARRVPFHGTLPARALGRDELWRATTLAVGEGSDTAAARTEGEILERLGLIPAGYPPGAAATEAYAVAAPPAARYDAATGTLLVPSFLAIASQREALIHEIAHAVADQRFGLRGFLRIGADGAPRLEGDAERARLALVEGDAMLAGLEVGDPQENFLGVHALGLLAGSLRAASQAGGSTWFGELGEFTHVDGLLFVARVRAAHSWSALDALWNDPPDSSEQVLHPEKYDACEAPIVVAEAALPALAGFGRPTASDVLGELLVRTWLASALPPEIAARAAAGWGGDRAGLYAPEATTPAPDGGAGIHAPAAPLAWLTVWDDAAEADDFARAARQALLKLSGAATDDDAARDREDDAARDDRPSDRPNDGRHDRTQDRPKDRTNDRTNDRPKDGTKGSSDDRTERWMFSTPNGTFALARRDEAVALLFAAPEPVAPALDAMLEAARPANRRAAPRPRRAAQPGCPRRDRAAGSG